nr:immunoglobulin light chain junction region [Macaca mulatta]
CQQYNDILFTF